MRVACIRFGSRSLRKCLGAALLKKLRAYDRPQNEGLLADRWQHRVSILRLTFVPVRIGDSRFAGLIQFRHLLRRQPPPSAPRFCISCSSLRAPMTSVETVGLRSSQLSAICATIILDANGRKLKTT